ncbi:hypothetical protein [Geothermobacter ehrlichii]|uniref:hypothetical protein n=1 Tax=Geothermobacter ehrlichii TaxID=213224 RepID=UPI0011E661F3|nr:hypothetical protein [Geothermobacter ehrlichii]
MEILKKLCTFTGALVVCAILMPIDEIPVAGAQSIKAEDAVVNTIYQIQHVLLNFYTSSDVEKMIMVARGKGATSYKFVRYYGGEVGWSVSDSRDKEVFKVMLTPAEGRMRKGKYLGPLMALDNSKKTHKWHRDIMSKYYKQIAVDRFYLGDGCTGDMKLFRGGAGYGRTIITVECQ